MFDIFLETSDNMKYPVKYYSKMDYIKRRYLYELERIITYYTNRDRATNNNHPISRLVTLIAEDPNKDPMDYFAKIDGSKEFIARQFKFVSNISYGELLDNIFYKRNSKELINSVNHTIDPYDFRLNWKKYTPLRVVYSEDTDIDFYNFTGEKEKPNVQITAYELDINIMMLQYKYWSLERVANSQSTNQNVFVYQIVLPRMMISMLDLTIWNRFIAIYKGIELTNDIYRHPFHVLDLSAGLDSILKTICKDLKEDGIPYRQLMNNIPTIVEPDMSHTLVLNRQYYTRQSEWSIWASRIDYLLFLLEFGGERGLSRNRIVTSKLLRYIRMLENGSTPIESKLGEYLNREFWMKIEKIKTILDS